MTAVAYATTAPPRQPGVGYLKGSYTYSTVPMCEVIIPRPWLMSFWRAVRLRIFRIPVFKWKLFYSIIASHVTRKKNKRLYIQGIFNRYSMCWKLKYYNTILFNQICLSIFVEEFFGKTQLVFFNNLRILHLILAVG